MAVSWDVVFTNSRRGPKRIIARCLWIANRIAPVALKPTPAHPETFRLAPFEPAHAECVASWISTPQEAYWLAPKDPPPIRAAHILAWRRPGREPLELMPADGHDPVAYGELNVLHAARGEYWLGHLIVAPAQRGHGVGRVLTSRLLSRAQRRYGARRVSLVVFPENEAAIACYRAAGFHVDGYEVHELPPYGRRVRLVRMSFLLRG